MLAACVGTALVSGAWVRDAPPTIEAVAETDPVPSAGDAADDVAICVNPRDPGESLIIGTDKQGGLATYDLGGAQRQYLPAGKINNIDLRPDVMLGGTPFTVVGGSDAGERAIRLWLLDPKTGTLSDAPGGKIGVTVSEPYGLALYRSSKGGSLYAFVSDPAGKVEQWRIEDVSGAFRGTLVRTIVVGSHTEGLVADDADGWLYASEEDVALWRYPAEPDNQAGRVMVDKVGKGGRLTADVEGLALVPPSPGSPGYLIASSQGDGTFAAYERRPPNAYVGSFRIGAGATIDGCSDTDGIEAVGVSLGARFPRGVFVAQDGDNAGANQNFKLVPLERVLRVLREGR